MRALDALARIVSGSLESPAKALSLSEITSDADLWGASGTAATRVGASLRCVQIIAGSVGACGLLSTNAAGDAVEVPALRGPRQPDQLGVPTLEPFHLWGAVAKAMALHGNAYLFKIRQRGTSAPTRIRGLQWVDPRRVEVDFEPDPLPGVTWAKRFKIDGGALSLTNHEILHIPSSVLADDGIEGLSVLGALRQTLETAAGADAAAERLFRRGMLTQGYLSTEQLLTNDQAQAMQRQWQARIGRGAESVGMIPVLPQGIQWHQLTLSPADAQFLETRRFSVTEIARAFGIFGWMVNDQEKTTSWGSGIESQFKAFVRLTVNLYATPIQQRVTTELCPQGVRAFFDLDSLEEGDATSRANYYSSGITAGWLVPNDARKREGLPPVPWGDEPYRPHTEAASSTPNEGNPPDDPES